MHQDMAVTLGIFPFPIGNRPFPRGMCDTPVKDARLVTRYLGCENLEAIRAVDVKLLRGGSGRVELDCVVETHAKYGYRRPALAEKWLGSPGMVEYKETYYRELFRWEEIQQKQGNSSTYQDKVTVHVFGDRTNFTFSIPNAELSSIISRADSSGLTPEQIEALHTVTSLLENSV
jgi:hypothetical protein